jgi:hypothetical protein
MPQHKPTWRWAFVVSIFMVPCAALSAWAGWAWMNRPPDHRPAVARAREMIDRGYPDLAIQALSDIRDEGQGAAEGLALAGKALLMRQPLPRAQGPGKIDRHAAEAGRSRQDAGRGQPRPG